MNFQKIEEFFENLDFKMEIEKFKDPDVPSDTVLKINGEIVYVNFKKEVRPHHIPNYLEIAQQQKPNQLLVGADYITPKSKEVLKANGVNYIDSYGNAFLGLKNVKIFIEKDNAKPVYNVYSEVFTRAGGQILFHLLQNPELINANYEHLAAISCASLGSVSKTIKGLLKEGYAVKWDKEKKYQLVKRSELLEKWVALANEKILPSHKIGYYKFTTHERTKIKDIDPLLEDCWGGEYGAKLITDYLNPENHSLFTNRDKLGLIRSFRMVPDNNGSISAYKSFWKPQSLPLIHVNGETAAPPLLIYAELIYTGNDRNLETAKLIFDEYIKPNL